MQLPQVHVIDAHAFQGALQFLFRLLRCTGIGFRRQVERERCWASQGAMRNSASP